MEHYNSHIIILLFSVGASIFYVLSCIERSCLPIAFTPKKEKVSEEEIRATHQSLRRLTPLLPPSYGIVVLGGTFALIYQCYSLNWSWLSLLIVVLYWLITLYTLLIVKVGSAVVLVKKHDSYKDDLKDVKLGVKRLILSHHWGLVANIVVLIMQYTLII